MSKLFSKEQIRAWLKDNNLKEAGDVETAFMGEIKDVLQECLEEEMTQALGYSRYDWKNKDTDNARNGHSKKTVKGSFGSEELEVPRDVKGEFEPVIVKKHERSIGRKMEEAIISMFAHGMSNRDIESQMRTMYDVDVSPEMVSRIYGQDHPES